MIEVPDPPLRHAVAGADPMGAGTPEGIWAPWLASLRRAPTPSIARVVVLSAHPDDDVLAVGGLLSSLAAAGVGIVAVVATDGEASHPTSTVIGPDDLRARRPVELDDARHRLGVTGPVIRLGLPDSGLAAHHQTLVDALATVVDDLAPGPAPVVLAPWRHDGHPDHDACGAAAAEVTAALGLDLLEFPIWLWHHAEPGHRAVPGAATRMELRAGVVRAKAAAIAAFRSQIAPVGPDPGDGPVLSAAVLARFRRPYEVVFAVGGSVGSS